MNSAKVVKDTKTKTIPIGVEMARALRDDAAALRQHASHLLGAEISASWEGVKRVRDDLVGSALEIEKVADGLEARS